MVNIATPTDQALACALIKMAGLLAKVRRRLREDVTAIPPPRPPSGSSRDRA